MHFNKHYSKSPDLFLIFIFSLFDFILKAGLPSVHAYMYIRHLSFAQSLLDSNEIWH